MSLDIRQSGTVVVAQLNGDIDMAATSALTAAISGAMTAEATALVVDLSDVRYLDSAGIQMLFDLARLLDNGRRSFGIAVREDSPVRAVVKLAHVDEVAALCPSVDECVDAVTNGHGRRD